MSTRFKVGFAGVLSCFVFLLSLVLSTGVASAHSTHQGEKEHPVNVVWSVHVDHYRTADEYNGYVPQNPTDHYLVVYATFANQTGVAQVVYQPLFSLSDGDGNTYSVTPHSTTPSYEADAYSSVATETAFIVPRSTCDYTLTLLNSVSNSTWSISGGC